MAVDPKEIPVVPEEVAGGAGKEPVAPSDTPTDPELAEGAVVPLEEFRRLEEDVDRLQSILQSKAADADARAEESDQRAQLALRYAEDVHKKQVRDGERWLASLDEEEQAKQRSEFEAWVRDDEARLQRIRDEAVNVPSRERRKVAQKFGIDIKELGDLEDPIEMYDKALEVLKAQKEKEPDKPPAEPETPAVTPTTRRVGPIQPTGGAPPPAPPPLVTSADVRAAGQAGDMKRVKELKEILAEQRKKAETALG